MSKESNGIVESFDDLELDKLSFVFMLSILYVTLANPRLLTSNFSEPVFPEWIRKLSE